MRSAFAIKSLVVIALVHFSTTVLADAAAQQDASSDSIAARAPSVLGRRSLDLGRSTRLHRSRRRRTFELPKPAGTSGAAETDEENIKLLQKYVEHQSEINTAVSCT